MANLLNVLKVIDAIKAKAAAYLKDGRKIACIVGYTAKHAIYVHENLEINLNSVLKTQGVREAHKQLSSGTIEMKLAGQPRPSGLGVYWGPNGGPKFLEGPFRRDQRKLADMVKEELAKGRTLGQALLLAGLYLQGESMMVVPVEYGDLKRSAFTQLEDRS